MGLPVDRPAEGAADRIGWQFENTYAQLPAAFFAPALPASVPRPCLQLLNEPLAADLGLDFGSLSSSAAAALFSGHPLPAGSQPIAQAYAGHQYGNLTMLGDGRAILLGEHRSPNGQLVDIQLKGAGPTAYSRRGDGLAALGPMLREYISSEAMAALGIPTTRSLAVVTTGTPVYRPNLQRGAILTRVAASHIRVGTFEYFAARQDTGNLRLLADYSIQRHYPHLADDDCRYVEFFRAVTDRQAELVARWQLVGFVHGVMNTDNMTISGETIDYGPCAFMNAYRPETVFSSIDHAGRYAYGNQPHIAQWNLARFAEALLPLLHADTERAVTIATEILNDFATRFEHYWLTGMRRKLGLDTADPDDGALVQALLGWMQAAGADFINTFRELSSESPPVGCQYEAPEFQAWYVAWQDRLSREGTAGPLAAERMHAVNPAVIPRNHRVEEVLAAAEDHDDLTPLRRFLAVLATPFQVSADTMSYCEPASDDAHYRTYCGT